MHFLLRCQTARVTVRIGLTGTPGVGKTTVASILSEHFTIIDLVELAEERGFLGPTSAEFEAREVDIEALSSALAHEWNGPPEKITIIEGHLSHFLPCDMVIVLRCEPRTLRSRLSKRNYPDWKITYNVEWELMGGPWNESDSGATPWIEFDTTDEIASKISDRIIKTIERGAKGTESSSVLDWAEEFGDL